MISIIIIVKNDRGIRNTLIELEKIPKPHKTEILVIDSSKGKLDDIKKEFSEVRWIYFHNKTNKKITIPEQRNLGLKEAEGNIIVFIDSDCIPTKNWLIELIKPITEEGENIVAGFVKSTRQFPRSWDEDYKTFEHQRYIPEAATMNFAFNKEVPDIVGDFDEKFEYSTDTDFCWRAVDKGYKIRYAKDAIIFHDLGDLKFNIRRFFRYGQAKINLLCKHPKKILKLYGLVPIIYSTYILLLPITILWFYYPLIIIIPLFKNIFTKKPLETVFFNLIYALGFIRGILVKILKSSKIYFRNKLRFAIRKKR
jgi:GT2 family glycosyltransferase